MRALQHGCSHKGLWWNVDACASLQRIRARDSWLPSLSADVRALGASSMSVTTILLILLILVAFGGGGFLGGGAYRGPGFGLGGILLIILIILLVTGRI